MPVRTRRFFGPSQFTGGTALAYTVPNDRVMLVQEGGFLVYNAGAAGKVMALEVKINGGGSSLTMFSHVFAANELWTPPIRIVAEDADELYVTATAASDFRVTAMGSLLDGDPS